MHSGDSLPPWKREQLRYPGLGCERREATIRRRTSTRSPGQGGGVKGEVEKAEPASCSAWTIPALLHWTSDPGTRKDHGTRNGAGKEIQEAITYSKSRSQSRSRKRKCRGNEHRPENKYILCTRPQRQLQYISSTRPSLGWWSQRH